MSCGSSAFIVAVAEDDRTSSDPVRHSTLAERRLVHVALAQYRRLMGRHAPAHDGFDPVHHRLDTRRRVRHPRPSGPEPVVGAHAATLASQGFVTVRHDESVLRRMNEAAVDHRQGGRTGRGHTSRWPLSASATMSAASQGAKRPIFAPELTRSDALLLGGPPVLGVSFMRGEVPVFSQARKAFFPTACSTRVASTLRCCEHGG